MVEEKFLDVNKIVKIEELPKIFYQLEVVGEELDKELAKIKNLPVNEETKQEAKKVRANVNNTLKVFEDKRKEIKAKILDPYEQFNSKYEEEVKTKLTNASEELKEKIDEIEFEQIKEKELELNDFINEHIISNHLENIVRVEDLYKFDIKVNLSTSLKSLQEKVLLFINRVVNDVQLINNEEFKDEILLEYRQNFDFVSSKMAVLNRHEELNKIRENQQVVEEKVKDEEKVEEQIEQIITPPKEIIEDEEMLKITFTCEGTKQQFKQLKEFMNEIGMRWE